MTSHPKALEAFNRAIPRLRAKGESLQRILTDFYVEFGVEGVTDLPSEKDEDVAKFFEGYKP